MSKKNVMVLLPVVHSVIVLTTLVSLQLENHINYNARGCAAVV